MTRAGRRRHPRQGRGALPGASCSPRSRARRVDEVLVIDSGSRDGSVEIARAAGRRGARDRAGATSATAARATSAPSGRRGDVIALPHAGRDAGARLAATRCARRSRSTPRRRRRVRPAPAAPGHEPDDRARADRVLRDVRARRRRAARVRRRRPDVPVERQRRLPRAPAGRRSASTTSPTARTRRSAARWPRHPRWRKAYHPRAAVLHAHDYPPRRVHAPLLRRVPRAARDDRARRAARRALDGARRPRPGRRATVAGCASRAMPAATVARWTGALGGAPHRAQGVLGARLARRSALPRAACSARCRSRAAPTARTRRSPRRRCRTCRQRRTSRRGTRPRLRGDRARARATGPAPLLDPVPGHGRPRAAARRVRDPAVLDRLGRPQHHLPARAAARADGPHVLDLAPRPVRPARTAAAGVLRGDDRRVLRAGAGAGLPRLRRLVRRRRRGRHRLADRVYPVLELHGLPRARVPRQRPRARVLRDLGRSRSGRAQTYRQGLYGIAGSPWLRDLYVDRYGGAAEPFQFGVDHDVYCPRPVAAAARHVVFYARAVDAAARRGARRAGARRAASAAARTCGSCCSATASRRRRRSRTSTSASRRPSSSRGCTPRRPSGSACR